MKILEYAQHRRYCSALRGPEDEGWLEEDKCDCGLVEARRHAEAIMEDLRCKDNALGNLRRLKLQVDAAHKRLLRQHASVVETLQKQVDEGGKAIALLAEIKAEYHNRFFVEGRGLVGPIDEVIKRIGV